MVPVGRLLLRRKSEGQYDGQVSGAGCYAVAEVRCPNVARGEQCQLTPVGWDGL